jgi:hypothetical protein
VHFFRVEGHETLPKAAEKQPYLRRITEQFQTAKDGRRPGKNCTVSRDPTAEGGGDSSVMIGDIENLVLSVAVLAVSVVLAIAFSHLFLLGMSRFLFSNRRR